MLVAVRIACALVLLGAGVAAGDDLGKLKSSLPAGWRLTITRPPGDGRGELVIRHPEPVRMSGVYFANAHTTNAPMPTPPDAPTITLQLAYRIEPRWSEARLDKVRATNAVIYKQLVALRDKYRIDAIKTSKGLPLPATDDERKRLADYQAEYDTTLARLVQLPRCTLGDYSLFDDAATYKQLDLMVDPASVMREAFAIVELVKRRCR